MSKDDEEKTFFESLARHLALKNKVDWYQVTREHVSHYGGDAMLQRSYDGSIAKALESIYPDHRWLQWKFVDNMPRGLWDNVQIQNDFVHHLARELKVNRMEDWYQVSQAQICQSGGSGLLLRYQMSPSKMITSLLPEYPWNMEKFTRKITGKWDNMQLQRNFLLEIGKRLNITKMEDWYEITQLQIIEKGGGGLLQRHRTSISRMITTVFSEHEWRLDMFIRAPKGLRNDSQGWRESLDSLGRRIGIKQMEDWYNVSLAQIREGDEALLTRYRNSPSKMLTSLLPEHKWDLRRFTSKPRGTWDIESQKIFMNQLAKKIDVTQMEQWYQVSAAQIREHGGGGLLSGRYSNSPPKMIISLFPEHHWNLRKFILTSKKLWGRLR